MTTIVPGGCSYFGHGCSFFGFSLKGCSSWFFLQKLDQTLRNIFQVRKRPFHWSLSKYHVRFWAALWFSGNYNISIIFSVGFSRIWSKFETGFNEMARNCSRDLTFRIQSLSGSGFSEKWILTILSNFLSTDKLSNFAKLQFLNDKIDKSLILPNYQVPNCYLYNSKFYHSRIEVLRNCSAFFRQFLW